MLGFNMRLQLILVSVRFVARWAMITINIFFSDAVDNGEMLIE